MLGSWRSGRTVPPAFKRTMALMIHYYKCLDSKNERINCFKPSLLQPMQKIKPLADGYNEFKTERQGLEY